MTSCLIAYKEKDSSQILELTTQEFFETTGVHYLSHLTFETPTAKKNVERQGLKGLHRGYISTQAQWLGTLFEPKIQQGDVAPLFIGWSKPLASYGLFARAPLTTGTFIGTYTGLIRRRRWLYLGHNDYCFMYPTALWSLRTYTIDAKSYGNEMRYINHASSYANVEALGIFSLNKMHILIRALRDIPQGEELLLDYGNQYWRQRRHPHDVPPSRNTLQ